MCEETRSRHGDAGSSAGDELKPHLITATLNSTETPPGFVFGPAHNSGTSRKEDATLLNKTMEHARDLILDLIRAKLDSAFLVSFDGCFIRRRHRQLQDGM